MVTFRADVSLGEAGLVIAWVATNQGAERAYVLHLGMYSGQPEAHAVFRAPDLAEIAFGLPPLDAAVLGGIAPQTVTWPSRSAGEPIDPGAELARRAAFALPLSEPDVAQGSASFETTITALDLVFRWAAPRAARPRRGILGWWDRASGRRAGPPLAKTKTKTSAFDLYGVPTETTHVRVSLPRPLPFRGSLARRSHDVK